MFEMYCYWRIIKISWVQEVKNIKVFNNLGNTISWKTEATMFGTHHEKIEMYYPKKILLDGKTTGKRSKGRRQILWPNLAIGSTDP